MKQVNEMTVAQLEEREYEFKFYNGLLHWYDMGESNHVQGNIMQYVAPKHIPAFEARVTAILFHALEMKGLSPDAVEKQAMRAYARHAKRFVNNQAMDQFIGIKLDKKYEEAKPVMQEMINIALDTKDESWFHKLTKLITVGVPTEERIASHVQTHLDKHGVEASPETVRWLAQSMKPAYHFDIDNGFQIDMHEFNRRLFGDPYGPFTEELPW